MNFRHPGGTFAHKNKALGEFTHYLDQNCPSGMTKNQKREPKMFSELDRNIFELRFWHLDGSFELKLEVSQRLIFVSKSPTRMQKTQLKNLTATKD